MKIDTDTIKNFIQSGNINFLIGSGLSRPFLPVLGKIEEQMAAVKDIEEGKRDVVSAALYRGYFERVILPNYQIDGSEKAYQDTFKNYCDFLNIWNDILHNRCGSLRSKQVNIFSTNIDLLVEKAAEVVGIEFNDGFIGSIAPVFSESNFQKTIFKNSVHFQNSTELPVFNLLKIHGSINWIEKEGIVHNDINLSIVNNIRKEILGIAVGTFPEYKESNEEIIEAINGIPRIDGFLSAYDKLLVVNPTKKKFSETVFDVHFYELMRIFSNSLEKENSILFVMGFSFADEHIRNIVKRALKTNPTLMVFVFSYKDDEIERYIEYLGKNDSNLVILTPSKYSNDNEQEGEMKIVQFDFCSINKVFEKVSEKISVHFGHVEQ